MDMDVDMDLGMDSRVSCGLFKTRASEIQPVAFV